MPRPPTRGCVRRDIPSVEARSGLRMLRVVPDSQVRSVERAASTHQEEDRGRRRPPGHGLPRILHQRVDVRWTRGQEDYKQIVLML